jgi:ribosome-binding protein aMBF1 (putative translation factor)
MRFTISSVGCTVPYTFAMPEPKLYEFSTHIGSACARKMVTFQQLSEKLKLDVTDLMRQCNAKAPPSKALVKGLARELDINEQFLEKLADEVRKDLG